MEKEGYLNLQRIQYGTMPRTVSSPPTPVFKSLMIFIDGGYLRESSRKILGHDNIDFGKLGNFLRTVSVPRLLTAHVQLDVIRAYYYDAALDPLEHPKQFKEESKYFERVRQYEFYEVKLGRLIKTPKRDTQKGVDVRIAIDMLTKAYQNHYDIATLLAGDGDFEELVRTVKDIAGKRVIGAAFEWNLSPKLKEAFDTYIKLDEIFKEFEKKP